MAEQKGSLRTPLGQVRYLGSARAGMREDWAIRVTSIALMPLTIETREVAHVTILDVKGRIVLGEEIGELRDEVHKLIAQGKKKIILNLAEVDYIDSSGVGELVGCFTTLRNAGGELKLLNLSQKVHDILNVTKLYTVFDIREDEFTAVKSFDYFFAK